MKLTASLRSEYDSLFATCQATPARQHDVQRCADAIVAARARYDDLEDATGVPWHVVGAIHQMESSGRFDRHFHNGDPLTSRTVHAPAGRPPGNPPFTWRESAIDALTHEGFGGVTDWSLAGTLFRLEAFNGWGYRTQHPEVKSPYLWSFSNHYVKGKYGADNKWQPTLVSKQCGAAVMLRRLAEMGDVSWGPASPPLVMTASPPRSESVRGRTLGMQRWLNTVPGVYVREDGWPGPRTADALRKVTGQTLSRRGE